MANCKNCKELLTGKFCVNCGQKASVRDLNLHELFHEFWHSFTHTDRGVLRLIKDLSLHPKSVYLNYFEGQRKKYFSPVTFFLIAAGILIFIGDKVFDYEDYRLKMFNEFGRLVFDETKFRTFILLPFEVLLTWLFFHKHYNLAKNIVFWFYVNGFLFTIKIFLSPLYFIFIQHKELIDHVIEYLQYAILLWHLILVFGKENWKKILFCIVLINVIWVAEYLVSAYQLFEDDVLKMTKTSNIFELILSAYKF